MTPYIKDLIKYFVPVALFICGMFLLGFFIGKGKTQIVDLYDTEPDRVYIQMFPVAGEDYYESVLVKEYKLDFVEKW